MNELVFDRSQALKAIDLVRANGRDWLYQTYPKPDGQMRKSTTGFLMHEGVAYPVKPLGRLANTLAGRPMTTNPITNVFRKYFESLAFQLIESPEDEAEVAAARQRHLAQIWERPGQAKFRREVFKLFGARCLITGCDTLEALEAAHILPVSLGGGDEGWNGIPLRADLHRLFDASVITIDPDSLKLSVRGTVHKEYGQYHGFSLEQAVSTATNIPQMKAALRRRGP